VIDRRRFLLTSLAGSLAASFTVEVAEAANVPRIAVLAGASPAPAHPVEGLLQGLRDLGYVDGQNIAIEYRWTAGKYERFREYAAEMVHLRVDVIVAAVTSAALAARNATDTIPIITVLVYDPVSLGLVTSFARPGGNVTGLTSVAGPGLYAKQLELLRAVSPNISRVAVLTNPANPGSAIQVKETQIAARTLGVHYRLILSERPEQLSAAFEKMTKNRADALLVVADPMFYAERIQIADLAARHRLPAMYGLKEHADAGGLVSYSADFRDLYRRAAGYVARVLKGAKPADLPVEQPTKFELVVNLKTAKALGLTIPPSLLLRADQVIE
jgi:putative tryptophan/tyrosine transport system substrate-binding protein